MNILPPDYLQRVYAGVLGKIVGVYFGRPVESWSCEKISERFGLVDRYVNGELGMPLVLTDDDIAGTFTFLRALEDYGCPPGLTPAQIGQTWLNYIIEGRTILWWGGLFHSTEHTAFINLKEGVPAPRSGSVELNGPVIANQIGAQIFIDGWALLHPGDPQRAADFAARAASVSHDDEAVNAARMVAAMEARAFDEQDISRIIAAGLEQIPRGSLIYRMVNDLCDWAVRDGNWRKTRERIVSEYGYKKYVGGCHVVPNHALIHLGLLYGQGDFRRSLAICVTAGWDTDCNAGNLGCLLGVRGGLAALENDEVDWRGPIADRLFLPSADGGRAISDAARETLAVVNAARGLRGLERLAPKQGARFPFELPGSLQGFQAGPGTHTHLENTAGHSRLGQRSLMISAAGPGPASAATATFILPADLAMPAYGLHASPTLYPGQTLRAGLQAAEGGPATLKTRLWLGYYDADDRPARLLGNWLRLESGQYGEITWQVPEVNGIIYEAGIEAAPASLAESETEVAAKPDGEPAPRGQGSPAAPAAAEANPGEQAAAGPQPGSTSPVAPPLPGTTIYLDYLTWDGPPRVTFARPEGSSLPFPGPAIFRRAWVSGVDHWEPWFQQAFRIIQDRGRGLLITGAREWTDYQVSARVTSAKFRAGGIAARVQGMMRFYALELVEGGTVRLLKALDGDTTLAETPFDWQIWQPYELRLAVETVTGGCRLRAWIDGNPIFDLLDQERPLQGGGVALVVERGHLAAPTVRVEPLAPQAFPG